MANVIYYVVITFTRDDEGQLVGDAPIEMPSAGSATVRAKTFAATKAGAIAFSRTGDPMLGAFSDAAVLFKAGEVPDTMFDRD